MLANHWKQCVEVKYHLRRAPLSGVLLFLEPRTTLAAFSQSYNRGEGMRRWRLEII